MNISLLREKQGLCLADFWGRVGVGRSAGCRYENGSRPVPPSVLILLEITYGGEIESARAVAQLRGQRKNNGSGVVAGRPYRIERALHGR